MSSVASEGASQEGRPASIVSATSRRSHPQNQSNVSNLMTVTVGRFAAVEAIVEQWELRGLREAAIVARCRICQACGARLARWKHAKRWQKFDGWTTYLSEPAHLKLSLRYVLDVLS